MYKTYPTLLLLALLYCAPTYSETLITIDIQNPNQITFTAVPGSVAEADDDSFDNFDGFSLLNVLAEDGADGDFSTMTGNLRPTGAIGAYARIDEAENTWNGSPRSLILYRVGGSDTQDFNIGAPAFSGVGTAAAAAFTDIFRLRGVGATGNIVSGFELGNTSAIVGQWNIVNSEISTGRITLEEPISDEVHGGIGNLRGFAFFQSTVEKIEIYIDGEFAFDAPYGGIRPDVAAVFPQYDGALSSGFSLAYGYSNLSVGEHSMTARAIGPEGLLGESSSTFTVVAFNETFISAGQSVDGTGADVSMFGDEIDVRSVQIGDDTYNIKLKWRSAEQGFEIIEIRE